MEVRTFIALCTLTSSLLVGCGGSGSLSDTSNEDSTITGYFRDSNVGGMTYIVADSSALTGDDGSYSCVDGSDITFSIGGVVIGTSSCDKLTTPIDLVPNGSLESLAVLNITRFLMLTDEDGNPDNGITISDQVQLLAKDWEALDFTSPTFDDDIIAITQSLGTSSEQHVLPTFEGASQHLEKTLLCAYSGAYKGGFSGDDNGSFGALISAENGKIKVLGYSNKYEEYLSGPEGSSFTKDDSRSFTGSFDQGAVFNGELKTVNFLSGIWSNSGTGGAFSANRIGGATSAQYRFTGNYTGSTSGLFSFDIDKNNLITGVAYNIYEDSLVSITGSVDNSSVTAQTSDGLTNITAYFDKETGQISDGQWKNTEPDPYNNFIYEGVFEGYGCKLN